MACLCAGSEWKGVGMSFHDRETHWFLAQLKPNCAYLAEKNLKRQGFRTFLPLEDRTRRQGAKFVTATQPLFPGYIFVGFDPQRGHWRSVNATQGITRLVSFGGKPAQVPVDFVSDLMLRCDPAGKILPQHARPLSRGDKVRIQTGPFADLLAEIDMVEPDQRAWILIDILGQATRTKIDIQQLSLG